MTYLNILFVTYTETASAFAKDLFPQGTEDCIKVLGYVQQKVVANTVFLWWERNRLNPDSGIQGCVITSIYYAEQFASTFIE